MAKVRFTGDFDWKPSPQVTLAFRAGQEHSVTRACATAAKAAGKAVEIRPKKKEPDAEGQGEIPES